NQLRNLYTSQRERLSTSACSSEEWFTQSSQSQPRHHLDSNLISRKRNSENWRLGMRLTKNSQSVVACGPSTSHSPSEGWSSPPLPPLSQHRRQDTHL